MKQFFSIIILYIYVSAHAYAQQPAQYTMYMFNNFGAHPSYAGLDKTLTAAAVYRQQWNQFNGAPITQQINAHMPLNIINSGFGINIENDKVGIFQTTNAAFSYAYHLRMKKETILSFGINTGIRQLQITGNDIRTPEGSYLGNIKHNDDILENENMVGVTPILDASLYYKHNNLQIGFTARNLFENNLKITNKSTSIKQNINYLFTFANQFTIGNNLTITPTLILQSDVKEFQSAIGVVGAWQEKFFGGSTLRGYSTNSFDAVTFIAGTKLSEKFNLYYSYDISISPLKNYNSGSHEIMLMYSLGKEISKGKPEKIIYNPRYF